MNLLTDVTGLVWESSELSLSKQGKSFKVPTTTLAFTLLQILLALPDTVEGFLGVSKGELDPIDNVIIILSPVICCIHLFNTDCLM